MDKPKKADQATPRVKDPVEEALVDLIEEHRTEAVAHELTHKSLIAEPHPDDHDRRHADPLKPEHHFEPDPHHKKPKSRDVL